MFKRKLGPSGLKVSALGLGCWAIGGPFWRGDQPVGWGQVDDQESMRALERALDLGVTFFDTADVYGCGHSERLLGRVLAGRRESVVLATKFGNRFDEKTRKITGRDASPEAIRRACEASLRRLQTDYIDLYQFHLGDYVLEQAPLVRDTLEDLVGEGIIRAYGWSTDSPERARLFAEGPNCAAIQHRLNIFEGNHQVLAICEAANLASINRSPLAMGLLTGKFSPETMLPQDDVRYGNNWNFKTGPIAGRLKTLDRLRDILTADGRTLAQAALGWLWAKSERTIPIPGFKTVEQVEENVAALQFGPLSHDQMTQIDQLLKEQTQ
jgi:aryl-alcohol dehydrogenase-like predicted oxidoreductase